MGNNLRLCLAGALMLLACGGMSAVDTAKKPSADDADASSDASSPNEQACNLVAFFCSEGDLNVPDAAACTQPHCYALPDDPCLDWGWCSGPEHGLLPPGKLRFEASSVGGFGPSAPAGSECTLGEKIFHYEDFVLDFKRCNASVSPYVFEKGKRSLNKHQELNILYTAVAALEKTSNPSCGADKPLVTIKAARHPTSSEDPDASVLSVTLVDSFYACNDDPGVIYVDGIDAAFAVFNELAYGASP